MVVIEVGAHLRMQTRRTAAFAAQLPVTAAHAVHVGRRRSDVRKVTPEMGMRVTRSLRRRIDFSLREVMNLPWWADMVQKEQPPKQPRWILTECLIISQAGMSPDPIARVRRPLVRQIERMIQLLGRKRRVGRRDDRIAVADTFDERFVGFHQVAQGFDAVKFSPKARLSATHSS